MSRLDIVPLAVGVDSSDRYKAVRQEQVEEEVEHKVDKVQHRYFLWFLPCDLLQKKKVFCVGNPGS